MKKNRVIIHDHEIDFVKKHTETLEFGSFLFGLFLGMSIVCVLWRIYG